MYLFIEIAMRGGISHIAKRYSKANNKYMKDYDNTEETIYIMYFDANNLYGSTMTECLPYGGFEWMTKEEINNFDLNSIKKDSPEGYILETDLEFLIPNLGNKKIYFIHYRNLQLYISSGMKVIKFHRILKFKQSDWMKKYIDFNTEKRKNANNNYKKIS